MQRKNRTKKIILPGGSRLRVGIVVSEFHKDITDGLLMGALEALDACKVKKKNIRIIRVPGSFEIPFGCLSLLRWKKYDALAALGCVIKGETSHNVYIASAVSKGIMNLSLEYGVPIGFGVVMADNLAQAKARSSTKTNRGKDAALAAVSMALSS